MTVIDERGQKVSLPRAGAQELWSRIQQEYAHESSQVWRDLAIFALREAAGWNLLQISLALGISKGHLSRRLNATRERLRRRFQHEPIAADAWELLSPDSEASSPNSTRDWDSHPAKCSPTPCLPRLTHAD